MGVEELRKSGSINSGADNNNSTNVQLQVWLGIRVSDDPNVFFVKSSFDF